MNRSLARNVYDVYEPFESGNRFASERQTQTEFVARLLRITGICSSPAGPIVLIPHRPRTFTYFKGKKVCEMVLTPSDLNLAGPLLETWMVYVQDSTFAGLVENPCHRAECCVEAMIDRLQSESPPDSVDPVVGCLTDVAEDLLDDLEHLSVRYRLRVEAVVRDWLQQRLR